MDRKGGGGGREGGREEGRKGGRLGGREGLGGRVLGRGYGQEKFVLHSDSVCNVHSRTKVKNSFSIFPPCVFFNLLFLC